MGLNLSRALYISLSVIQFMLVATSWSAFLCAFIWTWVVILPNTGIKLHMSMAECKWMLHIYPVWKKRRTLMFSKVWIKWFGHAMPPQLRVHIPIIIPLCVIGLTTHIILLFENGFWYVQRGAGSHWTFNVLLLKFILISSSSAVNKFHGCSRLIIA